MLRKLLYTMVLCLLTAGTAFAQSGVLTGTVTDTNGEILPGSNVILVELSRGTATDIKGNYVIENIDPGTYTVRVTFLGFSTIEEIVQISSGTNTVDFQLQPDTFGLDEIVVTGVISGTPKKKLAFTVGSIGAEELGKVPAVDASQALQGKMPGVKIVSTGGLPGQAAAIRLRGSTSLGGGNGASQGPLIIVDGVILDGTLADIPTQNIKSIEVLKGASAASFYGSRAANGVVQIFTKRGAGLAEGETSVTIRNEVGYSWLGNRLDLADHHMYARTEQQLLEAGVDPADYTMDPTGSYMIDSGGNRVAVVDQIADNDYGIYYDQLDKIYDPGTTMNNFVNVARNMGDANISLSFSNVQETGVVALTDGYNRQNVRINYDQHITDKLDFSASTSYSQSDNDLVTQGPSSPFWGALFMQPNYDLLERNEEDGSPYNVNVDPYTEEWNPLYRINEIKRTEERNRFLGNFQLRYRPTQTVLFEGSYSIDRANQVYERWTPLGLLGSRGFQPVDVSEGSLYRQTYENTAQNLSLTAGYDNRFGEFNVRFKASYLYEASDYLSFEATGSQFSIGGVGSWNAIKADGTKSLDDYTEQVRSENIYGIVTVDYKDRYIFDFLLRRDGSSLFGEDERYHPYFRVSGAYRISEDFDLPGINELKIRASYGTAGLRPNFAAQYLTYNVNGGNVSKGTLGNPDLAPALAKELEVGLNVDFLNRFSFMASYSTTTVEDQILEVPLAATAGGFESRWENAGVLESNTLEAMLSAQILRNKDYSLNFNIIFDRTRQRVTELFVAPYFQGPDTQGSDVFYVAEGEIFGVMYGNSWATSLDQLSQDQLDAAEAAGVTYQVNNEGYVVTGMGTAQEAPVKRETEDGNTVFRIGNVNPDFNLGMATNFNFKGFGLYFLLDAKIGGDIYNQTRAWLFRDARHGDVDQAGRPADAKKPVGYYAQFYNANTPSDYFIEDGTYLKLREIALSYQFDNEALGSLGDLFQSIKISAIGRNLVTLTGYSGYDPEISGTGGNDPTNFAFDGFSYPNFQSVSGSLELRF